MDNFVVSARKYRPATFRSVVGQQHITSTLKNAIERGQLAHAYLFCGPRGVGKTTCARIFARAINCTSPVDHEACGTCESCRSFAQGRSFNIHELDAASNNSVDDIRNLTEQVRVPPQIGRYSVYIIDEVHMLSAAAFNAFLKTLEEPPAHAIFILATTEKHKIIPTILSRCQIFDFNRIKVEDGVEYMKYIAGQQGVSFDDQSLNLIARKADGGMRDALSMFDKAVSFCGSTLTYKEVARSLNILDYDTYFEAVDKFLSGDYPAALTLFDSVLGQGFSGQIFMSGLNSHMRDLLVCKNPGTEQLLDVTGSLADQYRKQAAACPAEFLFEAMNLLTELDSQIKTSSNQRLLVELGLMKLCGLGQKKNSDSEVTEKPALPPLIKQGQPAGQQSAQTSARESAPASSPAPERPTPPVQTATAANEAVRPAPSVPPPAPAPQPKSPTAQKPQSRISLSGKSLSQIMEDALRPAESEKENPEESKTADSDAMSKIEAHRQEFIDELKNDRPRLAVAFETMELSEGAITLKVSSADLKDEILRLSTDIGDILRRTAGIQGNIRLNVMVDETQKTARILKPEEKLMYFTRRNPQFTEFRQKLDLDAE